MKTSTVVVKHRDGAVKVKVDAEDAHLFNEYFVYVKTDQLTNSRRIIFRNTNDPSVTYYASRIICDKHKMLDSARNVLIRNGDCFDLRKQNLFQA